MDNKLSYEINIVPTGTDKLNALPKAINSVSSAVKSVNTSMDPLAKIIKLLETTNKILMAIGKVGVESFNKLDTIAVQTADSFKKTQKEASKVGKEIEKIGDKADKSGTKASGLLSKFASFGQAFIGIKAAATSVAAPVMSIFEEGMMRQNAVSDFETLLYGDKSAAKKLADDIRSTDAATLYGTSTMNDAIKSMIGYGLDTETSFQMSEALGDIAMGDKNKLNSLTMAFSQMYSLGNLQTQDWKQMVGAGFNPFNQMGKDLGKTKKELDEMMSKGKISADMVKDAFIHATQISYKDKNGKTQYTYDEETAKKNSANGEYEKGQYFGATAGTLDGTLTGKFARISSLVDDLKARIFELAAPLVEKLIPVVTEKIFPLIERMWPLFEGVCALLEMLTDYIIENWDAISDLAVGIGSLVGVIMLLTSPVTWTIAAIALLTAGIIWLYNNWEEWHDWVVAICYPLAVVIDIIKSVKKHWDSIVEGFKSDGILEGIKRLGLAILDGVLTPVQSLLELLSEIPGVGKIAEWALSGVSALRENINNLIPETNSETKTEDTDTNSTMEDLTTKVNAGTGGNGGLGDGSSAAKGIEKVATGGTRNTQITITLGNLVENVNFNGGVEENRENTLSTFQELLLRVLTTAETAV